MAAQTAKPLEPKAASAEPLSATKPSSPAAAIAAIGPTIAAKAWILYDVSSQQVLAAHEAEKTLDPASLTKLMTAYMSFAAIKEGRLKLDQRPPVSQKAWKALGSRMFVDPGKPASVEELLKGMIVQSGNDASVVLAETLAGSEEAFAQQMNREAQRMGLKNTQYRNATGLPDAQHYSSAYDLALLASQLIREFPDRYPLYSLREYSYNNIKQPNRNRLLAIDPTVDGLKTGHTEAAGWCLVASSRRKDLNGQQERRLLSVVLGAASV
ncbi:MAG: D-alanyl-D-alanine carboxypeptidase [Betaproteobacteria bacterium]|nr:D-alanyl-D-alanine carboxypeptidase [Betaproteobacteria bacterium]